MPGPEIISSSYFGVGNFEAYKLPAEKRANGIVLNGVFYPYQLKQFTGGGVAGSMGYMITVEPGKAYYIRDFWWIYKSGGDFPVIVMHFYDYSVGFKQYWYLTDMIITPNTYVKQHFDVKMLMPGSMQFVQTFDNELLVVPYMEIDLYCAIVPSIIQVDDKRLDKSVYPLPDRRSVECRLMDWIEDKCDPPLI